MVANAREHDLEEEIADLLHKKFEAAHTWPTVQASKYEDCEVLGQSRTGVIVRWRGEIYLVDVTLV